MSWERKEHLRWNKKHFASFLKGYWLSKNVSDFRMYLEAEALEFGMCWREDGNLPSEYTANYNEKLKVEHCYSGMVKPYKRSEKYPEKFLNFFNPFVPNTPFQRFSDVFRGVEKGCSRNGWVTKSKA